VAVINSRVAERTHLKQNMGKMDMPKIKPIIRSVAWGALTLFSSGVIAQTPNHLATDPILPFRAAAPSLPSQAQLDAQPQLSLPSDQQIRQAQSRQTEDFKKGMAKAEGGPGAGSGFRPFSGAASDQQRDAYRQSVNAASSQFTERFARSATDDRKVAAGLARPGQEDRLQELLRQQQAAQQTRERRNNSGTAAVPEDALLVFVSFSMPDHVLRALSDQARAVGATLILRGMVNGRLSATQEAALKVNGAGAGWEINPELFTTFDVQTVPAFVLTGNKRVLDEGCAPDDEGMCSNANTFSKVSGNISIDIALDTMRRRTDIPLIRDLAERRLDSLAKARG
jgi:type-F conjugative transfer system pilin assembly protein TrbC